MEYIDNIVVYGDERGVVFKSKHDYKLKKTGIPAYKLIVEKCGCVNEKLIKVENPHYMIVLNNVVTGGCVGLLITLNVAEVVFNKDQTVFRVVSEDDCKTIINSNNNNDKSNTIISSEKESLMVSITDDKVLSTNFTDTSAIPEFSSSGTSKTSSVFNKYYVESKRK